MFSILYVNYKMNHAIFYLILFIYLFIELKEVGLHSVFNQLKCNHMYVHDTHTHQFLMLQFVFLFDCSAKCSTFDSKLSKWHLCDSNYGSADCECSVARSQAGHILETVMGLESTNQSNQSVLMMLTLRCHCLNYS